MDFHAGGLLVLGHVLFASLWFGGAAYQLLVVGGALRQAGPAAGGFLVTVARRGGIGKFFAVTGGLAILFGALRYGQLVSDGQVETFEGRGLWLTLGAVFAVLAYLHGAFVNLPTERQWIAFVRGIEGHPTRQQGEELQRFGMRMGKHGAVSFALVAVAMVLMLLGRVLA